MSTTQKMPHDTGPGQRSRRWPRRLALGASLAVAVGVGVGIGAAGHSTGISQSSYNASLARVASLKGQVSSLKSQVSSLNGRVSTLQANVSDANAALTTAQNKAATAQKTANAKAAATYRSREQALAQMQQTVKQQQATLKRELGEVQASSISGDGVYVVGKDIKAGTWHTNGSGDTGANDCYFATLNSTDTSDIADNNDFDGPETVDVSSAYAFQIGGPCSWVLVP